MKPDQARGELPDVANEVHQGRIEGTDDDRLDAPLDSENKVTETDMLVATDTTFDVPPNKADAAAAMEADAAMEVDAAAMVPCNTNSASNANEAQVESSMLFAFVI